jgi:hypothetical protein
LIPQTLPNAHQYASFGNTLNTAGDAPKHRSCLSDDQCETYLPAIGWAMVWFSE